MNANQYRTFTADDFILDEKFRKIVSGKSGSRKLLDRFIEKLPERVDEIELAANILNELKTAKSIVTSEHKQELWQKILKQEKHRIRFQYLRFAATGLLILGIGTATFFLLKNNQNSIEDFAALNKTSYKDAELILSDGKKVDITSKESNIQYTTDGTDVSVNDSTKVDQEDADKGYNQLIVPYGKRSTLLLSDGTKVWLNSGSRLVYAPVFRGKTREVYLEGEGYFEVAKNEAKPFFVKTDALQVKVYGTKFDVQAYSSDNEYNTILIEGKVSLDIREDLNEKEIFLTPNQKASFAKEQNEVLLSDVDNVEKYIGWIDGFLTFENETIDELIKRVSHYYNVTINSGLRDNLTKISGKLDLKEDPERVIATLAVISKTRYVKQGTKYLFYE